MQLCEQCKKNKQFLLCKYYVSNAEKKYNPVNSIPHFFITKQLQLRFKKNAAAAAEPNGLAKYQMWRHFPFSHFNTRSLLVTALPLSASLSSPNTVRSMSSSSSTATMHSPPVAKKVEHKMEMFGDVRVDNYYWLRDDSRTNPEVLSYLQQENAYTDSVMSG